MNRKFLEQIWTDAQKELARACVESPCSPKDLIKSTKFQLPYLDDAHEIVGFINEMELKSVAKMQSPLTQEDAAWLLSMYPKHIIMDVLCAMENYKPLNRKYKSAKLTANNWCAKRMNDRPENSTNVGIT